MDGPNRDFDCSRLERVLSGPGKVAALGAEVDRLGRRRALIVTGRTIADSPILAPITGALGSRSTGVFSGATQHVPRGTVEALVARIDADDVDCLVSVGGGSPIDSCKVAHHLLLEKRDLVHIAVPTTLSASEYTHAAGVTDESTLVKSGVSDPRLQPRAVLNDPQLAAQTPDWLWAATGIRALDHAVESIYSKRHHPLSDTLGSRAISLLVEHLPDSVRTSDDARLAHRGHCQTAAWFSIFGAMNARFGISHLLGHQIGPRWNVAHGVTSCITLPHAMRFMADVAPGRFAPIAEGFGVSSGGRDPKAVALDCADRTGRFIARFGLPTTLRQVGVPPSGPEEIVDVVLHEIERGAFVDRPVTREDVLGLLSAAYGGRVSV